jgi:GMP synthase-like glutamine amidotransferase
MKIYCDNPNYTLWLGEYTPEPEEADIIMFSGGADVNPAMYNQNRHKTTGVSFARDAKDTELFESFPHTPKVGICRGSQFLTVMAGGSLVQDCDNHAMAGTHEIQFTDGEVMNITSTHHQMMYPFLVSHSILARAARSTYHKNGEDENMKMPFDPEIVYYPEINSFCIQGHPEMMREGKLHKKLKFMIKQYLL